MMSEFQAKYGHLLQRIMTHGEEVEVGEWQSQDVSNNPDMISRELRHHRFELYVPASMTKLQELIKPNLPWAEDHFQERVGGKPLNPPPSEQWWPYAVQGNKEHKADERFSHTYPERFWPKHAGHELAHQCELNDRTCVYGPHRGIRYELGDLDDVIDLLRRSPLTRQAFLPVWFPEDTGAIEGQRVPCTLGYHFLLRNGRCDIVYHIRSCDLLRHFTDDVYMACRLLQWVCDQLQLTGITATPDRLIMNISSLHAFRGDYSRIHRMIDDWLRIDEEENPYGAAV